MRDEVEIDVRPLRRPGRLAVVVLLHQLFGLVLFGLIYGATLSIGWEPDLSATSVSATLPAAQPLGAVYRSAPPRRRTAAGVALLVLFAVAALVSALTDLFGEVVPGWDLGLPLGFLVGLPTAAATFAGVVNRAERAAG